MPRQCFQLTAITLSLAIAGCNQPNDTAQTQQTSSTTEGATVQVLRTAPQAAPTERALEEARQRVSMLTLEVMLKQEEAIQAAYKRGDRPALAAAADGLMQGAPDAGNWKTPAFDPYLKCDTAWRDLGLLALAMRIELDEVTDTRRKITSQELADFQRTKKSCIDFLAMPGLRAWEAEEARFAK